MIIAGANGNLRQPSLAVDATSGILARRLFIIGVWLRAMCIQLYTSNLKCVCGGEVVFREEKICFYERARCLQFHQRINWWTWAAVRYTAHIKMISEYSSTWLRLQFFSLAQRWIEAAAPLDGMQARSTTAVLCKDNRLLCSVADCVKIWQFPSICNIIQLLKCWPQSRIQTAVSWA